MILRPYGSRLATEASTNKLYPVLRFRRIQETQLEEQEVCIRPVGIMALPWWGPWSMMGPIIRPWLSLFPESSSFLRDFSCSRHFRTFTAFISAISMFNYFFGIPTSFLHKSQSSQDLDFIRESWEQVEGENLPGFRAECFRSLLFTFVFRFLSFWG